MLATARFNNRTLSITKSTAVACLAVTLFSHLASADQTKAPSPAAPSKIKIETVATGLSRPWAVAEMPDGRLLVTERSGRMRLVKTDGKLSPPFSGLPAVWSRGQGGLLDVAIAPDFAASSTIYFSYSEPRGRGRSGTSLAKARLDVSAATPALKDVTVIFRQKPDYASNLHFGSRIVFSREGTIYLTLGDRFIGMKNAQQPGNHIGKVVHINADGSPASNNPRQAGWAPEVWSIGHRNIQGAALHPETGVLWTVEHGAQGGDKINIPAPGKNYGWPVITYGRDYSGAKIGVGTHKEGLEQPVYYWDPSIAPSGMAFYESDRFPAWKGSVFIGALAGQHLTRLTLSGNKVIAEEKLLTDLSERIRDVQLASDGSILVITDEDPGRVLRITPQN